MTTPLAHTDRTAIAFNQGQALLRLAGTYPTLLEVILEAVQNALDTDVGATRVWITVNYQTRHLAVRDNGAGTSIAKFNEALASVAQPKRKGERSLGEFGLGLIAPLGKCKRFVFVSCPKPAKDEFQEWTFVTEDIVKQISSVTVPIRPRKDLTLGEAGRGKTHVEWRSEMSLHGFTEDAYISRVTMDDLIAGILDRYSTTMRRNDTRISVEIYPKVGKPERRHNVTAPAFKGKALEVKVLQNPEGGQTTFRLFLAKKAGTKLTGRVSMGIAGRDFRFPFYQFAKSADKLLSQPVIEALKSGLFEGEILSEKCVLRDERQSFEKNDALVGLCLAIEEWWSQFGSSYADLKKTNQEERFQDLGLRSMKVLEALLKDPMHEPLLKVIQGFGKGTVGQGHAKPPKKDLAGQQESTALSAVNGQPGRPRESRGDSEPRKDTAHDRPPHTPLTVAGPRGQHRRLVKSSSFGLQLAHEAMDGPDLWKLDIEEGVLVFNIRHQHWRACEEKDVALMRLQEVVVMQALTLEMMPADFRLHQRKAMDQLTFAMVTWILAGDKVRAPAKAV